MVEYVIASLQSFRISRATARDRDIFYKRQEQVWDSETAVIGRPRSQPGAVGRTGTRKTLCLAPRFE